MPTELSLAQKQQFLKDGFIVLRQVVDKELTWRARRAINVHTQKTGTLRPYHDFESTELPDLMNRSDLGAIIRSAMGPYDAPQTAFAAVQYPIAAPARIPPNFGWAPHVDGWWYSPDLPRTPGEVDSWQAPRTEHFGRADASEIGANMTPFFQDPDCTLSIGSFTAFVGVALNDQTEFGRGNLALLQGAHEKVESFFQMQRDAGGIVGPEGPGWPRLQPVGNDGVQFTSLPPSIAEDFLDTAETTEDGRVWLKPSPVLLDEGDAVIALHACPHNVTMNLGADPRLNVYFRLRRKRPGQQPTLGDSDHPDREWNGGFLDFDEGYNPWKASIDTMCDHWSDWDGMQEVVAEARTAGRL